MELKLFTSVDLVAPLPLVGGAIAARVEEPVQDGEEDSPDYSRQLSEVS
jgi:hypothetical protein